MLECDMCYLLFRFCSSESYREGRQLIPTTKAITCCLDLDRRAITLGLRVLDVSVGGLWGRNLRVLRGRVGLLRCAMCKLRAH